MSLKLQNCLTRAQVPNEADTVQVGGSEQRPIRLKTQGVDGARMTLLHKNFFLLGQVPKPPSSVVGARRHVAAHRVEVYAVANVFVSLQV